MNALVSIKPLLVLDINGTLLDRLSKRAEIRHNIRSECTVKGKKLFLRPHLSSFLIQISKLFDIACWTSAKQENGEGIINKVFNDPELGHIPLIFAWYREDCEVIGTGKAEVSIKHLSKIWESFRAYTPFNTIILDDSPHKSAENRNNALLLPTYSVCDGSFDPFADTCLLSVLKYLKVASVHISRSSTTPAIHDFLESNPLCTEIIQDSTTNPKLRSNMQAKRSEPSFAILPKWHVTIKEIMRWSQGRPAYRVPLFESEMNPGHIIVERMVIEPKLTKNELKEQSKKAREQRRKERRKVKNSDHLVKVNGLIDSLQQSPAEFLENPRQYQKKLMATAKLRNARTAHDPIEIEISDNDSSS